MKKGITFGAFDLFHAGHNKPLISLLLRMKGDHCHHQLLIHYRKNFSNHLLGTRRGASGKESQSRMPNNLPKRADLRCGFVSCVFSMTSVKLLS